MAVVHHDQGVELIGQVADALQVGDIAIHGEYAVGGDELHLAARAAGILQLGAEVVHIVVLIAVALGLAQTHAVDDGGVVQLVGDDGVLRPQQGLEEAPVGVEAGGVEDDVVHSQEFRQLLLQLLMDGLGPADKADGAQAEAPLIVACLRRLDQGGVVGEAQVVVGAHVDYFFRLGGVDPGLLGGGDDPLALPGTRLLDGFQFLAVFFQCLFHSHILLKIRYRKRLRLIPCAAHGRGRAPRPGRDSP